jgi:chromosomal replication initiator protein
MLTQIWDRSLKKIEEQLGEKQVFDSFFAGSYIYDVSGNTIVVVVANSLASAIIKAKYYDLVVSVVNEITGNNYSFEFVLQQDVKNRDTSAGVSVTPMANKQEYFADAKLKEDLTFDNFVVGAFNREASHAASLIASKPGKMFNPLFIYSESGLGKTHLMNAVGNHIIKEVNPAAKILYINGNDFVETYLSFVRGDKEAQSLKDYFKSVDVLLLDDIQLLANKVKTEEMFFYIYQAMINSGRQIVITSDRQPTELNGLEDRLVTRFTQGLVVKIDEPDQNTCVNILRKKIEENSLDVNRFEDNVLYFFADKFNKNIRELEGALNRLIFEVGFLNKVDKVTMDVAINAVSSLSSGKQFATQLNEQKIINAVADYYNLTPSQLTGKTRTGQIALARHIAMYLIRNMLDIPLKKIGDMFGGKDHTTVMSALTKVDKELKTNESLKEAVEELKKRLKAE